MNVHATAKFVGTSQRKVGLVAALIRGRKVGEAVTLLGQTPKRATDPVGKVLQSAIANAENNYRLKAGNLTVDSVLVGPGPTLKRYRPRAQGRAFPILKRTSHITVILSDGTANTIAGKAAPAKSETNVASTDTDATTANTAPTKAPRATQAPKGSTRGQGASRHTNQRKGDS